MYPKIYLKINRFEKTRVIVSKSSLAESYNTLSFKLSLKHVYLYRIGRDLRRDRGSYSNDALQRDQEREAHKVMKILTVVVIVFALLMLPNHIVFLWFDFGDGGNIPLHRVTYRASGRNIVSNNSQQFWMLHFAYVRLHALLHVVTCCCVLYGVVAQSLKPVKHLSQQLPTFLLFRDRRNVG